jgi:hypothetical protein
MQRAKLFDHRVDGARGATAPAKTPSNFGFTAWTVSQITQRHSQRICRRVVWIEAGFIFFLDQNQL